MLKITPFSMKNYTKLNLNYVKITSFSIIYMLAECLIFFLCLLSFLLFHFLWWVVKPKTEKQLKGCFSHTSCLHKQHENKLETPLTITVILHVNTPPLLYSLFLLQPGVLTQLIRTSTRSEILKTTTEQ